MACLRNPASPAKPRRPTTDVGTSDSRWLARPAMCWLRPQFGQQDKRGPFPASPNRLRASSEPLSRVRTSRLSRQRQLTDRVDLRMTPDDLAQLRRYAAEHARSVAPAALFLVRSGLAAPPVEPSVTPPAAVGADLLKELGFHNLIATEQVIKLLETIVRDGQGAADRLLPAAAQAAQIRLARGESSGTRQR